MTKTLVIPDPGRLQQAKRHIGEVTYRYRKQNKHSQQELADTLGLSAKAIANLEHGEFVDFDILAAVVQHYKIPPSELLFSCEKRAPESVQGAIKSLAAASAAIAMATEELKLSQK